MESRRCLTERKTLFAEAVTYDVRELVQPFVEWRPQPDLNIRFELENATQRGLKRTVYSYAGPRSQGGAAAVDDRIYESGRAFYLRVRKTFGG